MGITDQFVIPTGTLRTILDHLPGRYHPQAQFFIWRDQTAGVATGITTPDWTIGAYLNDQLADTMGLPDAPSREVAYMIAQMPSVVIARALATIQTKVVLPAVETVGYPPVSAAARATPTPRSATFYGYDTNIAKPITFRGTVATSDGQIHEDTRLCTGVASQTAKRSIDTMAMAAKKHIWRTYNDLSTLVTMEKEHQGTGELVVVQNDWWAIIPNGVTTNPPLLTEAPDPNREEGHVLAITIPKAAIAQLRAPRTVESHHRPVIVTVTPAPPGEPGVDVTYATATLSWDRDPDRYQPYRSYLPVFTEREPFWQQRLFTTRMVAWDQSSVYKDGFTLTLRAKDFPDLGTADASETGSVFFIPTVVPPFHGKDYWPHPTLEITLSVGHRLIRQTVLGERTLACLPHPNPGVPSSC